MAPNSWIPFAFLAVNKPPGCTSHDVVKRVRRLLPKDVKVGHTGTLDPFATGILILALGKATKFADDIHRLPKHYRAKIRLGYETDTLDINGQTTAEAEIPEFDEDRLEAVAAGFTGAIDQVPPAFSAKRVDGQRSYELARRGQAVTLAAKRVQIHHLRLSRHDANTLDCQTLCSTGTYVRALGRDIARELGTLGHLCELVRDQVGPVTLDQSVPLAQLSEENLAAHLLPVSQLLPQFPEIELPRVAFSYLIEGRPYLGDKDLPEKFLAVFKRDNGDIAAILRCDHLPSTGLVQPRLVCYLIADLR